jgi:hypothetical protein
MDQWWKATYHTPRQTTIDAGRDSAADREDLKLGLTSYASIYASRGEFWQDAIDQKIAEQAYIRSKCEAAGIPVSEVQFIPNQPQAQPAVTPPSAAPADEVPAQAPVPELSAPTETVTLAAPVDVAPEPVAKTEAFAMKDDADFNLSSKELDMVAKSLGLKDKKPRKKKSS